MMQQHITIVAGAKHQADRECRDAGLSRTNYNPMVRYIFDAEQLRGTPRGFILCFLGTYQHHRDIHQIIDEAKAREARIFYSLDEALQAASEPLKPPP